MGLGSIESWGVRVVICYVDEELYIKIAMSFSFVHFDVLFTKSAIRSPKVEPFSVHSSRTIFDQLASDGVGAKCII